MKERLSIVRALVSERKSAMTKFDQLSQEIEEIEKDFTFMHDERIVVSCNYGEFYLFGYNCGLNTLTDLRNHLNKVLGEK